MANVILEPLDLILLDLIPVLKFLNLFLLVLILVLQFLTLHQQRTIQVLLCLNVFLKMLNLTLLSLNYSFHFTDVLLVWGVKLLQPLPDFPSHLVLHMKTVLFRSYNISTVDVLPAEDIQDYQYCI